MMESDVAGEIGRLHELLDKGIITQAEFDKQKKILLRRSGPGMSMWRRAGYGVAIGAVVVLWMAGVRHGTSEPNNMAPGCGTPEVKEKVILLANDDLRNALVLLGHSATVTARIDGVVKAEDIHGDKETGFRACAATLRPQDILASVGYTVEWVDKDAGKYLVRLENESELRKKYGAASAPINPVTAASAAVAQVQMPIAAPTPAPASSPDTANQAKNTNEDDSETDPEKIIEFRLNEMGMRAPDLAIETAENATKECYYDAMKKYDTTPGNSPQSPEKRNVFAIKTARKCKDHGISLGWEAVKEPPTQ